jgi:hypothetical protein
VASTSRAGRKRRPPWKLRVQDEDAIVASVMAESMDSLLKGNEGEEALTKAKKH